MTRAKSSSLIFTGRCLGILNDLMRLFKNYRSEWVVRPTVTDWFKVASGTIWQLFATIAPAISIGLVYNDVTGGAIGVTEILISESYKWAFERQNQYGYAAAYSVLIFLVLLAYSASTGQLKTRD